MPRIYRGAAALLVSALVSGCAPRTASPPAQPAAQEGPGRPPTFVEVTLRDFAFEPTPLKVTAGVVRFQLTNRGNVEHDFVIPALEAHKEHEKHVVKPGGTTTVELELKPGTYEAICTVPGHKEAGMVVMVEVNP